MMGLKDGVFHLSWFITYSLQVNSMWFLLLYYSVFFSSILGKISSKDSSTYAHLLFWDEYIGNFGRSKQIIRAFKRLDLRTQESLMRTVPVELVWPCGQNLNQASPTLINTLITWGQACTYWIQFHF